MESSFAERLRHILGNERQIDFAARVGIAQATLSNLLNGKQQPGPDVMIKLAQAGYNVNWLLTGKGGMYLADLPDTNLSPDVRTLAEKLTRYPELLASLRDAIETREKLEAVKKEMKAEFEKLKKKRHET